MIEIGTPVFQSLIRYNDSQWYVIVTDKGKHFYFNKALKKSSWSIIELVRDYQVNKDEFVHGINFDEVALLMGKVNGLAVDEEKKAAEAEAKEENEVEQVEEEEEEEEKEEEEEEVDQLDLVKKLLKEEGFMNEKKEEPKGLSLGYSSSEEEENDAKEESHSDQESINQGLDLSISDDEDINKEEPVSDEEDINKGLDLSVSDEEDGNSFFQLLDKYKDQISLSDPWFIVQDELITEFIKNPEYYSIDDNLKESLYEKWVRSQENPQSTTSGPKTSAKPTLIQSYYHFLQDFKNELKNLYFNDFKQNFKNEFKNFTQDKDESQSFYENHYRLFKLNINDHSNLEKSLKKQKKLPKDINFKKQRLTEFLNSNLSSKETSNLNLVSSNDFDQWIHLCNQLHLPLNVTQDPLNFIVGDEKRLQCYLEVLNIPT